MSSENGWIPWDERKDVQKYVVIVLDSVDFYTNPPTEYYSYYFIGSIPKEYVADFEKEIDDPRWDLCIKSFELLNEQEKNQALRFFMLHKDDKEGAGVYLWNLKRTYEKADKLKYELFCNNKQSTLESVPVVSDSPAVPASAPAVSDSPADNKPVKPELTQKKKGGRPSKETTDKICYAIIKMFISYQSSKPINDITELEDAVQKINRRLKDLKCNDVKISVRQLDVDKIPGRLFRCLWRIKTRRFEWGYNEDKFQRDIKLLNRYREKYEELNEWLEIMLNRL